MKREDVKTHIPGITDEALKWLMDENGSDINREKAKADAIQKQLDTANAQLSDVQDKLKAFDGVDVDKLRGESDKLRQQIAEMQDGWAKGSVIRPTARDAVAAAGLLVNSVSEGSLTWYRPQQLLRESAVTAVKRPIGGGFGFGGENSLPIEACALALWGAKTSRRDPTRKMRIG